MIQQTEAIKEKEESGIKFFSRYARDVIQYQAPKYKKIGGRDILTPGRSIEFDNHIFCTEDDFEIKFLRNHALYGKQIFEFGVPEHQNHILGCDKLDKLAMLERKHRDATMRGGFRELR